MASNVERSVWPEYHSLFTGEVKGAKLTAYYQVSTNKRNIEDLKFHIAATISCGLGVHFDYIKENLEYFKECCPKVSVSPGSNVRKGTIKLELPLDWMISERLDITQILNFVYGDFFEESEMTNVKLDELELSPKAIDYFMGPLLGVDGIRSALGTSKNRRPHIGVVPHPPVGMSAEKYAQQCFHMALAGADHIVDCDVLCDPKHCSIQERVNLVMEAMEKARSQTEKPIMYSVNITSDVDKLLENADKVIQNKGKSLVALGICVANTGLSALRMLREYVEEKRKGKEIIPIHVHVTGLPLMTRDKFGLSYKAFNTLVRLLGADIVHTPSLTGRYVLVSEKMTRERSAVEAQRNNDVLTSKPFKKSSGDEIKPVFPLVAGGITPANAEYHIRLLGNDIILLVGAGLFKEPNPEGNIKRVQLFMRALKQSIDLVMKGENVTKVLDYHITGKRKLDSEFKDLVDFFQQHKEEFQKWDWRNYPFLHELEKLNLRLFK